MLTPTRLSKKLGVGGHLVPFFKCVGVYFMVGAGHAGGSVAVAAAKCAPILCLFTAVLLRHGRDSCSQGQYARRVAAGLAMSALGDALLVWPEHFVDGMAAFACAHMVYISAFGLKPSCLSVGFVGYGAMMYYMSLIEPPAGLRVLVPLYAIVLVTMAWRGVVRAHKGGSLRRAGAAGALLFLLSDAILGYSLFGHAIPHKQVLVMSTYYLGQLGIALSAMETGNENIKSQGLQQ